MDPQAAKRFARYAYGEAASIWAASIDPAKVQQGIVKDLVDRAVGFLVGRQASPRALRQDTQDYRLPHLYVPGPVSSGDDQRMIRHCADRADRIARAQYAYEGHGRISASYTGRNSDALHDRIFQVLMNSIQLGKRRYDFLSFSSSQLRDQAC